VHRAVQARSWPMQTPCAAHPGTRQVEACSRDKKCDIHRRTSRTRIPRYLWQEAADQDDLAKREPVGEPAARLQRVRPRLARRERARLQHGRPSVAKQERVRLQVARPQRARPQPGKPQPGKPQPGRPSLASRERVRLEVARQQCAKPQPGRVSVAHRQPAGQQSERRQQVARWRLA
jgi:hypothetical protein